MISEQHVSSTSTTTVLSQSTSSAATSEIVTPTTSIATNILSTATTSKTIKTVQHTDAFSYSVKVSKHQIVLATSDKVVVATSTTITLSMVTSEPLNSEEVKAVTRESARMTEYTQLLQELELQEQEESRSIELAKLRKILPDPANLLETFLKLPWYDDTYFGRVIEGYPWYAIPSYVHLILEHNERLEFPSLHKPPASIPEQSLRRCTGDEQGRVGLFRNLLKNIEKERIFRVMELLSLNSQLTFLSNSKPMKKNPIVPKIINKPILPMVRVTILVL